ncbi:MAG: prepilin-type N-terminal cleavage/methylation domain-containing protein [Armatimonadota bacterium]
MVRKGFTLIELLVVIAIIAVLAAILFPVFTSAKAKAYESSCCSNLNQLYKGMTLYMQDNEDKFPWATEYCAWENPTETRNLRDVLGVGGKKNVKCSKYITNTNVFECPADVGVSVVGQPGNASKSNNYFRSFGTSYGYRGYNTDYWSEGDPIPPPKSEYQITWLAGRRINCWAQPSKVTCCNDAWIWHRAASNKYVNNGVAEKNLLNVMFIDGHVKPMPYNTFVMALYQP